MWIWRQFPKQIASDLRARGEDIKHWLRATRDADGDLVLSSYELLYILEFLPETSAFKTAAERGGRWESWKAMLAENTNEAYRLRSNWLMSKLGKEGGFDTAECAFRDPIDQKRHDENAAADAKAAEDATERFEADIGFLS